jgi:aspartyl-tRNA(Asn)/glutamyl-tRNA(Gln) amidotransferase subunit A
MTIHEAAAAMRAGRLTPAELLDQCLERVDRYEPHVRAWVVLDRDGAREQAGRLTDELKRGQDRGPLHGIPVGVKDIIDVFDLPTGCGSKLWANSIARQDAPVVKRLRQAGAVILGKTVTTAYAFLDPPVTRNPWDLGRTPGGSSSGSAAAVACGMCLGALGSQTVGSVTRPASYCGVCSIKPSHGFIPLRGILPLAPTLDHVGAMARCVRDLAYLTDVLVGTDPDDAETDQSPLLECVATMDRPRQTAILEPDHFTVCGGLFTERAEPVMSEAIQRTLNVLAPGASYSRTGLPAAFAELLQRLRTILAVEAAVYHGPRLHRHPDDYPPKIRSLVEEGLAVPAVDYRASRVHRDETEAAVNGMIGNVILLTPATTGPAPDCSTTGEGVFNAPWSYTGHPTVSLPIGRTDEGLPLAVQLVGRRYEEPRLLIAAAWLEKRLQTASRLPTLPQGV